MTQPDIPAENMTPDPAPEGTPETGPETGETPKTPRTIEQVEADLAKARREAASWRTKLREAEPLAKKALEAEEASKTEIQKANERAQKAESALQEREVVQTRFELAVIHKIGPDDIDLIGSGTREEMEARAKRVASLNAAASKATPPPSDRPVEGLRPGATPEPQKPADHSYPSQWTPKYIRDERERVIRGQ